MPETAADPPSAGPFPNKQNSLLNREKFPVGREFRQASHRVAAICCIPEAESRDFNGLVLIFFGASRARVRARGQTTNSVPLVVLKPICPLAGLVPAIHVLERLDWKTWVPGTSPGTGISEVGGGCF
jgi:hypothetical protein